ncbi:MAG: hypothetical protein QMD05_11225, partial [Candidatus Brocadiaceae bacterium]|nr:hypothetical protein [Candidatus Brocadiaceae bacterium]
DTGGWAATYGGTGNDLASSIHETRDGGYIVAGSTNSFGARKADAWVLKLRPDGTVEWQKTYGGLEDDGALSICQTSDGGYVVAGGTRSFGAGKKDCWVLKLRADGTVEWQKTYGGAGEELATCIQQTVDGGYILVGSTWWRDKTWVLKLRADGTVEWQWTYWGNAQHIQQTGDGG